LEETGAKVGEYITAPRMASKPATVEEIQERPDGSRQTVRINATRGQWQVDNHAANRHALIKAHDVLVKSPEDRKKPQRNLRITRFDIDEIMKRNERCGVERSVVLA
jgi:hypothetical protein